MHLLAQCDLIAKTRFSVCAPRGRTVPHNFCTISEAAPMQSATAHDALSSWQLDAEFGFCMCMPSAIACATPQEHGSTSRQCCQWLRQNNFSLHIMQESVPCTCLGRHNHNASHRPGRDPSDYGNRAILSEVNCTAQTPPPPRRARK